MNKKVFKEGGGKSGMCIVLTLKFVERVQKNACIFPNRDYEIICGLISGTESRRSLSKKFNLSTSTIDNILLYGIIYLQSVVEKVIIPKSSILHLRPSRHLRNFLVGMNIRTIRKLCSYSADDLVKFRGIGEKTIDEIRIALKRLSKRLKGE